MISSAVLFVDCRCTLGEGILWWPDRQSLLWTDIERSTLWMHNVRNSVTRQCALPDRLGSFAICESGRLLLGLAKSLVFADPGESGSDLRIEPIMPIEPDLRRTRINDGRTDRAGNFVFGTMNEPHDAPSGSFYQYSVPPWPSPPRSGRRGDPQQHLLQPGRPYHVFLRFAGCANPPVRLRRRVRARGKRARVRSAEGAQRFA